MIELTSVSKEFRTAGRDVAALDNVSLSVPEGQFVAVRGPSGCGKSTLLSIAGGLAMPTSGAVNVAGQEISSMSPAERAAFRAANIGFVFQMFHLLPYLSVRDNVLVAATAERKSQSRQRAEELIDRFGLKDRAAHRPAQLSAGERQRTAMARALLNSPRLLLADEPTGNLDPQNADALLQLVADFHSRGGTVLLVTHDERAAGHADRTIQLREGRLEPESASQGAA